ncbi:hypothetical protein LXA43DRAFT_1068596 [Ganoderma leucocontextum]|nr:hypothetical protein LXA43DRAFT_1068596 [Ganoderma leucocontextum]
MANKKRTPAQMKADEAAAKQVKEKAVKAKQKARKQVTEEEDRMAIEDMKEIEQRKANSTPRIVKRIVRMGRRGQGEAKSIVFGGLRVYVRRGIVSIPRPRRRIRNPTLNSLLLLRNLEREWSQVEEPSASEYNPEDGSEATIPGLDHRGPASDSEKERESELTDLEFEQPDEPTPKPPNKKRNVGTGRGLREAIESERAVTGMTELARSTERAAVSEPQRDVDIEMRDLSRGHTSQGVGAQLPGAPSKHAKYAATLATFTTGSARHTSAPSSRTSSSGIPSAMRTKAVPRTPFAGHREMRNKSDTLEQGGIVSDDEAAEHAAAQASPEKTPNLRLTSKALVRVNHVDVTTTPPQNERRTAQSARDDEGNFKRATDGTKTKLPSKGVSHKDEGDQERSVGQSGRGVEGQKQALEKASVEGENGRGKGKESAQRTMKGRVNHEKASNNGDNAEESGDGHDGHHDGRDSGSDEGSGDSEGDVKPSTTKAEKGKGKEKEEKKKWTVKDPQSVPTSIADGVSVHFVQKIWDAVYGGTVHHVVAFNDPVHFCCSVILQATQRLYDWRKSIGYSASQILDNFFDNDPQQMVLLRSLGCMQIRQTLTVPLVERILELWANTKFLGYNEHKRPVFEARIDAGTGEEILGAVSKLCMDV